MTRALVVVPSNGKGKRPAPPATSTDNEASRQKRPRRHHDGNIDRCNGGFSGEGPSHPGASVQNLPRDAGGGRQPVTFRSVPGGGFDVPWRYRFFRDEQVIIMKEVSC